MAEGVSILLPTKMKEYGECIDSGSCGSPTHVSVDDEQREPYQYEERFRVDRRKLEQMLQDQWEGYLVTTGGRYFQKDDWADVNNSVIAISFDHTNSRLVANITGKSIVTGYVLQLSIIYLFKQEVGFVINSDGCQVINLTGSMDDTVFRCIPDNAKYAGPFSLPGVDVDMWVWTDKTNNSYRVTVSKDGCIPVSEVVQTIGSNVFGLSQTQFTNYTDGIKNPSIFVPPPSCPPPNSELQFHHEGLPRKYGTERL